MSNVFISGGNGLIGRAVAKKLKQKGFDVFILTRNKISKSEFNQVYWNWEDNVIETEEFKKADIIIHLAGANLTEKRWSNTQKLMILDSRVKSAAFLLNKIIEYNVKVKTLVSSSAIGYYGTYTSDKIFTETDNVGNDFLAHTCYLWEKVVENFKSMEIRTVKIRTGVVLSKDGGLLPKMIKPTQKGIVSVLGTGKQFVPWIHIDDIADIYVKAVEDENMQGVFNGVAPQYSTNSDLTMSIAKILKKDIKLPKTPAFVLKMIFGEMSSIMLEGSRISAEKIQKHGYIFKFSDLDNALIDLIETK